MDRNNLSGNREIMLTVDFFHKGTIRNNNTLPGFFHLPQHIVKDILTIIVYLENTARHHSFIIPSSRFRWQMKHLQQRTVREVDMKIGIIRNHTVTYGMEDIIKFITLLHQFILYQQASLGMYPPFGFTSVNANQPHNRGYQQCQNRWIEENK